MMDKLISEFPAQLVEAMEIGENISLTTQNRNYNKVYVAGMGGSGIGANIVAEFISNECKIPYLVGKGYDIPAYIDKDTLFIASSYSGNTEETLSSLERASKTGATIIGIASGGSIIQFAKNNGFDYVKVPGGSPSPRACLGYSVVSQIYILQKLALIGDQLIKNIKSSSDLINYDQDEIKNKAQKVAELLHGKTPVIYAEDRMEGVATRLRQQINENAKTLCWHHVIPEMNHNELVGWHFQNENIAVVMLRNRDDNKRNQVRMEICKDILRDKASSVIEIYSKGASHIEKAIYFIHLGDWISWYLSEMNHVDAIDIEVIDYLKSELSKIG